MRLLLSRCPVCGNLAERVRHSGAPIHCCGGPMADLRPGETCAAFERHAPLIARDGDAVTVSVGAEPHPMRGEHYIEWISLTTRGGIYRRELRPGEAPSATFHLPGGDEVLSAAAYCNLHLLFAS